MIGPNRHDTSKAAEQRRTAWWAICLAAAALPILVYAYSTGPPAAATGGFGEPTCVDCHIGTGLNAGPGSVTITAPSSYASGQTYQITVRVADPNQRRWGFEFSARTQGGQQAGSLNPSDAFTQRISFGTIQYIEHTSAGTRPGTTGGANFTFNWQAPNVSAGLVVFHAAGNAANNSGTELGDRIYVLCRTNTNCGVNPSNDQRGVIVTPQAATPPPDVSDGGTVNNASFAPHPAPMAPGSIAAIFGSNLNDGSTVLFSSFGADGKLVTTLGGASVTVNDIPAPMFYSTPGQVGIQIPFELQGQTSASVKVTVAGQSSTPRTIFLDSVAPGLFTVNQQGTGQGAILIANSDVLVAPVGSIPGRTSRPARPGEIITIFGTGLGAVSPPLATGSPSAGNTTATAATVTIDGLPATVNFSGTAPGFVGLNQINVTVPANARVANDVPVVVSLGGKQSNTATIAIAP